RLGARFQIGKAVHYHQLSISGLCREYAAHGQAAHLARHVLLVRARVRAEHYAAMPPLRSAGRTLASAPGALLTPGLAPAATHFGAGLGVVRTLASVGLLAQHRLTDSIGIRGDAEDSVIKFYLLYFFTRDVVNCRLHSYLLRRLKVRRLKVEGYD